MVPFFESNGSAVFIMDNSSGLAPHLGEVLTVLGLNDNGFTLLFCSQGELDFSSAANPCGGCGNIDQKTRCDQWRF